MFSFFKIWSSSSPSMPSVAQMSLLAGKIIGDVGEDEDAVAEMEK